MKEKDKKQLNIILILFAILILGIIIGDTYSSDAELAPIIDKCNEKIRACYDQLITRTQCETKFVLIKNFDNDTTFTTQP